MLVGDQVDGSAQRIDAEIGRHHALVDLYMVNQVHGQIGQRHLRALGVEGHAIDEEAYGVARHAVE